MTAASAVPLLPIVLRPVPGENVRGFLRRLAAANGHRSMDVFARAIGLHSKFGPTSAAPFWDRLARAASLTEAEVQALCWNTAKEPGLVVAGVRTAYGFAYPGSTRVCLACLRESSIRRDFWSFAIVAACPRHATLLTTHCTCGRPFLPSIKGRTWECVCGATLDDLTELSAPTAAVNVARNLAARVGPL